MRRALLLLLLAFSAACVHRTASPAEPREPPVVTAEEPALAAAVVLGRPSEAAREGSTVTLARAGTRTLAFVSDVDGERVHVVDVDAARELASLRVRGAGPAVLLADGRIAVLSRADDAVLFLSLLEADALRVERTLHTGREPTALALSADDRTLLVATAVDRTLEAFDVTTGATRILASLDAVPSAVVDGDGDARALVAAAGASAITAIDADGTSRSISLDANGQDVEPAGQMILEPSGDRGEPQWSYAHGMGTAHLGGARAEVRLHARHATGFAVAQELTYVVHELMVPTAPTAVDTFVSERATGYGGSDVLSAAEHLGVSVLERRTGKRLSFTRTQTTCRLPRGQAFDAKRKELWVACAGSDALVALVWSPDVVYSNGYLLRPMSPSFNEVRAVQLPGSPDGLAIDAAHERVIVSTSFGGAVAIVDQRGSSHDVVQLSRDVTLGADDVQRGRRLFHRAGDARIARDGRACASCHIDGLADGLVWKTPQGPRSTPILAGRSAREGAFGWNGQSADLSTHLAVTIRKNLGGKGLPAGDLDDLAAYLRSLPAPAPPRRSDLAVRGEAIFRSEVTGCSGCHAGPRGSDGERHDVRSRGLFLTPSLTGLARSGPYFHDGRFRTLDELLAKTDGAMGTTRALSASDRDALRAYLGAL